MLSAPRLRQEHEQGLDDRPHRVKRLRDEFAAYCDYTVPRGVADVEAWYRSHKSVITRRLREQTGYYDDPEADE